MKKVFAILIVGGVCATAGAVLLQAAGMPLWAYGYIQAPPATSDYSTKCTAARPFDCARGGPPPDDGRKRSLPGGSGEYTLPQIAADFGPVDWFPNEHGVMPEIVKHGREKDGIRACSLCHLPNGSGKPENAPIAGTSVTYFLNQIADFKSGKRKSADKNKANAWEMNAMAQALTPEEARQAAEFFAAIKFPVKVKVVEATEVPKFTPTGNNLFMKDPGNMKVPLGNRLIEMAEDPDDFQNVRNPKGVATAFVPPGTLAKGQALATTGGNGRTIRCDVCHGPGLRGLDPVPAIAGRQASYIARQLYEMQVGARNGEWTQLMKGVVAKLTEEDIMALSAYVAAQQP